MVVELRKRKIPAPAELPAKQKSSAVDKSTTRTNKRRKADSDNDNASPKKQVPKPGDTLDLDLYQDEIKLHDGASTSLKALVEESKDGVVVFTYPRASTPGCTRQACRFRDDYAELSSTGFSIFGLSSDSEKANSTFKSKQKLPYPLICDPSSVLISAIGFKKNPKGTVRGVFAVDKAGKVLLLEPGKPEGTAEAVQKLVEELKPESS